jgi:hypothetical protein
MGKRVIQTEMLWENAIKISPESSTDHARARQQQIAPGGNVRDVVRLTVRQETADITRGGKAGSW